MDLNWMYTLYEWTWHLGGFGNFVWATYLGINSFAWLFIPLFLGAIDYDDSNWFRNTFGVWIVQVSLFFLVGLIGWIVY